MMAITAEFKELFGDWIASVTSAADAVAGRLVRSRRISLDQGEDGTLTAKAIASKAIASKAIASKAISSKAISSKAIASKNALTLSDISFRLDRGKPNPPLPPDWVAAFRGSRVEAQLPSGHVMACPLDFPAQAGDFLDGMIRAQIDRLTPWTVHDAIFGWTPPVTAANERIEVTFAATSKSKVEPLLQFVQSQAVSSVAIYSTVSAGAGPAARIKLLEQSLQSTIGSTVSLPRLLRGALLATGIAAAASLLVAAYLENSMQSEQSELQRQISQRRAALRLDPNATGSGLGLLAKRKQTTPSSIMVMEAISRALPDTTYVTELRIEGDKVQVVGMTQDAPSLIKLMEQSPQFTRATFFAPTTRAANEPGERFHIEAHITAYFGSGT
jgi:general secretion pathway protein L